ncbi:MAG TPA: hypothetical protein VH305_11165 [Gaiella sp.]|jgi:hypothetical protein
MGASSGWNLETRRPRVRTAPTTAAATVVRLARVPGRAARHGAAVTRLRAARQTLRAQAR